MLPWLYSPTPWSHLQEIGWVAEHLGHSEEVHYRHYRTHNAVIEVGKIVKLLHACEQGTLHTQAGKNIDSMG